MSISKQFNHNLKIWNKVWLSVGKTEFVVFTFTKEPFESDLEIKLNGKVNWKKLYETIQWNIWELKLAKALPGNNRLVRWL